MANVVDRVIEALRGAGLATGDGEAKFENAPLVGRFVIVWMVAEHAPNGPVSNPTVDRTIDVQVTSCGPTRLAVDQVSEKVRAVALGPLPAPTDCAWLGPAAYVVGNPTGRDTAADPNQPDVRGYYRADLYRFRTTPA